MEKIDSYREKIDKIDKNIFNLLEKRFRIVKKVGEYKKEQNIPIKAEDREKEIINKAIKETDLPPKFIKSFYKVVFNNSYSIEESYEKEQN